MALTPQQALDPAKKKTGATATTYGSVYDYRAGSQATPPASSTPKQGTLTKVNADAAGSSSSSSSSSKVASVRSPEDKAAKKRAKAIKKAAKKASKATKKAAKAKKKAAKAAKKAAKKG